MGLTLLLVGLSAATLLWFWNHIAYFFQTRTIPWVRERLGNRAGDLLANLISFVDTGATYIRRAVRRGYRWLCQNILRVKSKYKQENAYEAIQETSTILTNEQGGYEEIVVTKTIPVDELPNDARRRLIAHNQAEIDDLEQLKEKIKARAEQEEIELENAA
ncbi:MAG: hypothetical protein IKW13_04485 [Thermoguttaceae bacterium]|nr:hypothetical protein [Thermoguttaceae bacterium]